MHAKGKNVGISYGGCVDFMFVSHGVSSSFANAKQDYDGAPAAEIMRGARGRGLSAEAEQDRGALPAVC